MKKNICMLLIFCMTIAMLPINVLSEADHCFLAIEAESGINDMTLPGAFQTVREEEASGGKAMKQYSYEQGEQSSAQTPLKFIFNVETKGKYKIYIRMKGADSVKYSVNFSDYQSKWFRYEANTYTWALLVDIELEEGENVLAFSNRKIGFVLDKIIVTDNILYYPIGMGQDASEYSGLSYIYPEPAVYPQIGMHPRVIINRDNIQNLKATCTEEENRKSYEALFTNAALHKTGILPQVEYNNYDAKALDAANANALLYQLTKEEAYAEKAVGIMLNYLSTVRYYPGGTMMEQRGIGGTIFNAALIYDWCHDAACFTAEKKEQMMTLAMKNASLLECGWPSVGLSAFDSGHGWENSVVKDLFAFAIAVYDEYPEIYDCVAGRIFSEYIPVANFHYENNGSFHRTGDDYGIYRFGFELYLNLLLRGMGYDNIINPNQHQMAYQAIYRMRPDGGNLRDGDIWTNAVNNKPSSGTVAFLASYLYRDPYLKQAFFEQVPNPENTVNSITDFSLVMYLALNDVTIGRESRTSLPLTHYSGNEMGVMTARTGWNMGMDSNDMVVSMKLPERYYGGHQHLDAGNFTIYYKGALAIDSGMYQSAAWTDENGEPVTKLEFGSDHDVNYHKRTVAHNSMLIRKPGETGFGIGTANDGGQKAPSSFPYNQGLSYYTSEERQAGKVISHAFGSDPKQPSYTYMKGELSGWYSDKVENFERSFLFYNFFDEIYPGALIVFDKVTSADPSYKKTWLLHSQEEPSTDGTVTTVRRTENGYSGRLVNETLLPENPVISKIGGEGYEYYVDGKNYTAIPKFGEDADESGNWRIEVSPSSESKTDYFLNILQVSENDVNITPLKSELYENENFYGVRIKDKAAYFSKNETKLSKGFTVSAAGDGTLEYTVCGLAAGTWGVFESGRLIETGEVTETGAVLSFKALSGTYEIKPFSIIDSLENWLASKPDFSDAGILSYNITSPVITTCTEYFSDGESSVFFAQSMQDNGYELCEYGMLYSDHANAVLNEAGVIKLQSRTEPDKLTAKGQFGIQLKDSFRFLNAGYYIRTYAIYRYNNVLYPVYGNDIYMQGGE